MEAKPVFISKLTVLLLLFIVHTALAEVQLPAILGSNMVLQRQSQTKIWGTANPGQNISLNFRGQTTDTKANRNGNWQISIATGQAGGPFKMTIKGKNTIELENIMVGDVWICSGQSNMEWPLWDTENGRHEIQNAQHPNIRLMTVENTVATEALNNAATNGWHVCTPANVQQFSAVAYYFGKNIHLETGIPIGLISTNWGGTIIETWISEESAQTDPFMNEWLKGLKEIDLETMAAEQKKIFEAYHEVLKKVKDPDFTHPNIETNFDDSNWDEFEQPGLWENNPGYENFDGVVWFRKTFDLPEDFNTEKATLSLARIDDTDITWLNGVRVGETYNQYNLLREYEVGSGLLKPGKNQLSIRVEDYSGGGGIHGEAGDMYISDGTTIVNIAGKWKMKKDKTPVPQNPQTAEASVLNPNQFPTLLFNGMINPLLNYAVKGAIWYQGESNANTLSQTQRYKEQMRLLITDWRKHWNNPELSFYMVQLANYMAESETPQNDVWPYLREAQAAVANDTGVEMACIIDIGDADDIHPRNKVDVGYRLALKALKYDYEIETPVNNGPRFSEAEIDGNKAVIRFDTQGSALLNNNKYGYVNGFAVAGSDKVFHYAKASVLSNNEVLVESNKVEVIEAIRFLWANNPGEINLYNSHKLPAEPFRTDKW